MDVPLYDPANSAWRFTFSPHRHPHLLFTDFFVITILTGVRWYLLVVLIWIFLMISDIEHLLMCMLAICLSSLEKCLLRSSSHFKSWVFCCCCQVVWIPLYFGYSPLITYIICKYLFPIDRLSFCSVDDFLHCAEPLYFGEVPFVCFWFCCPCWGDIPKEILIRLISKSLPPIDKTNIRRVYTFF